MVTDAQVRALFSLARQGVPLRQAALRVGLSERTARRYRRMNRLPSESLSQRTWRTREDVFAEVWDEIVDHLRTSPSLQAKTLFDWLQRKYPQRFDDGQLRTLQRRIKFWRATEGPAKEIFFQQVHHPGDLCASDFTRMSELGVTIAKQPFDHMVFHFVLTYSNWESISLCHSESFESLAHGIQEALWSLGGVPQRHRTDRFSAAVNNLSEQKEFTARYQALMRHYGLSPEKIRPREAHENGDVESSHNHFKIAVDQALQLRDDRDFATIESYQEFLQAIVAHRNGNRRQRLAEERSLLRPLPTGRVESCSRDVVIVNQGSLIRVQRNTYSVPARLIGERVEVRTYADYLEIWYGQRFIERLPRLRGSGKHAISYRHVIDWLIRKPSAFENYRYRDDLYPTSRFRLAYDVLCERHVRHKADKEYLQLLQLAAFDSEVRVDDALRIALDRDESWTIDTIRQRVLTQEPATAPTEVIVESPELSVFDELLQNKEVYDGYEYGCEIPTDERLAGAETACIPG